MVLAPSLVWLALGALMIALEAFGIPGIGFLFAGIAAILTGMLAEAGVANTTTLQIAWFLGLTTLAAAAMWRPLKRWRTDPKRGESYRNMLGDRATVLAPGIGRNAPGHASWSGTTMRAELSPAATVDRLEAGAQVRIVSVEGNCLIVLPQPSE